MIRILITEFAIVSKFKIINDLNWERVKMEKMERGVNADLLREFHDKPVLWPNGRLSHSTKRY